MTEPPVLDEAAQKRFWAKVDIRGADECWLWTACRYPYGYGKFTLCLAGKKKRTCDAHRLAFFLATGEWPPMVLHKCDVPPCSNPRHLKAGTRQDNMDDMTSKGRQAHGDGHWSKKHPDKFDPHAITRYAAVFREEHPESRIRGEDRWNSKLTDDAVRDIRRRYAGGVKQKHLAREYGIDRTIISRIVTRKRWQHVD